MNSCPLATSNLPPGTAAWREDGRVHLLLSWRSPSGLHIVTSEFWACLLEPRYWLELGREIEDFQMVVALEVLCDAAAVNEKSLD